MNFQLLCTGASPGHGSQSVQAIQVPVSVGGMDVVSREAAVQLGYSSVSRIVREVMGYDSDH